MYTILITESTVENIDHGNLKVDLPAKLCFENNNKISYPDSYLKESLYSRPQISQDNAILEKCFHSWLQYSRLEKSKKTNERKLNEFLNGLISEKETLKLRQTKGKVQKEKTVEEKSTSIHNNNAYQKRFVVQKNIIAYQKAKIEEQQRYIEALKVNKIVENIAPPEETLKDLKKFLSKCDNSVKPRLKHVMGEAYYSDGEEDTLVLKCMKVPKFLQKMEKRAREREEKWAIVKERRRQIEMEKERLKEQILLSKQLFDQEKKMRRLNELKEERKKDQLKMIRAKEFREKMRALNVIADLHYEKKLREKYGIIQWKAYVKKMHDNFQLAVTYHEKHFLESHFKRWRFNVLKIMAMKNKIAENMFEGKLKLRCFIGFKKEYREMVSKRQVAEDWYDLQITDHLFVLWKENTRRLKTIRLLQSNMAEDHYNQKLLWRIMGFWETLPKINSIEREKEIRKQKWRLKVQEVLPDYIPKYYD